MLGATATSDLVETGEELEKLRPEWQSLLALCDWATPFQSPDWLIPWWRCLGAGFGDNGDATPFVIACKSGGDLVGLAPLFRTGRKVLLMGSDITDHLGVSISRRRPRR